MASRLIQNPALLNTVPALQTVGNPAPVQIALSASTSSVTLSPLPLASNLRISVMSRLLGATGIGTVFIRCNSNTGANYDGLILATTGSTATGSIAYAQTSGTIGVFPANSAATGNAGHAQILIAGVNAPFYKPIHVMCSHASSGSDGRVTISQLTFRSTGSISSINFASADGDFATGAVCTVTAM